MKKAFYFFFYSSFLLFLLLILVLFLGWIRFDYPNNYRGVIYYKTSGYQKTLITPLSWNWNWQHIIPRNTKLYIVKLDVTKNTFEEKGELPSAEIYSVLIDNIEKFDYKFTLNYQYTLKEEFLVELFEKGILQESQNTDPISNSLQTIIMKMWKEKISDILSKEDLSLLHSSINEWEKEVMIKINDEFYYLNNFSINVTTNKFPDITLYKKAKETMNIFIKEKEEEQKKSEIKEAQETYKEEQRIYWLEQYGKLLKEYPELAPLLSSNNLKLFPFFSEEEIEEL